MKEKIIKGLKWFYRSYIWLGVLLLVIDIVTKQIIMHSGVQAPGVVAEWGFVNITYIQNPNAAFGLGAKDANVSRIIYLIVASIISLGLMAYLIIKRKETKIYIRACLIMVIAGAVGNMVDRIFYEQPGQALHYAVVDWIDFYWVPGWVWNFNIADSCIVVAAFMLIIYVIVTEVKELVERRKAEASETKILSKSEQERLEEDKEGSVEEK